MIWSDQSLSLSLFCVCRIVDMIKRRRKDDRYTFLAAKKSSFTWKKKKKRVAFATVFCNMVCDPVFWSPGISYRIYPYAYDNGKLCIYKVENKPHKCPPLQTVSLLAKPFNSAIIILFKSVCVFKQPLLSSLHYEYIKTQLFFFKAKALASWSIQFFSLENIKLFIF